MQRRFQVRGGVGSAIFSSTGFAEGCAMSACQKNPSLDVVHYTLALRACAKASAWQASIATLAWLRREKFRLDNYVFASTIDACSRSERWSEALAVLKLQPMPSLVASSSAMTACEKAACWPIALELLKKVIQQKLEPDRICYSSCMSACEKGSQWQAALSLLKDLQTQRVQANIINISAVMSAMEKAHRWREACALLSQSHAATLRPSTVSFSAAISAAEKGRAWWMALRLLEEVERLTVRMDVALLSSLVAACDVGSCWAEALALLHGMPARSIQANLITQNAALSACNRASQWQMALSLWTMLQDADHTSCDCVVQSCATSSRWAAAAALLRRSSSWNSIAAALRACYSCHVSAAVLLRLYGIQVKLPQLDPFYGREQDLRVAAKQVASLPSASSGASSGTSSIAGVDVAGALGVSRSWLRTVGRAKRLVVQRGSPVWFGPAVTGMSSFNAKEVQGRLEAILAGNQRQVAARCALYCSELVEAAREDERRAARERHRELREPLTSATPVRSGELRDDGGAWTRGFFGDSFAKSPEVPSARAFVQQPTLDSCHAERTNDRDCVWILRTAFAIRNKVINQRRLKESEIPELPKEIEEDAPSTSSLRHAKTILDPKLVEPGDPGDTGPWALNS
eukprot:s3028_g2.t2